MQQTEPPKPPATMANRSDSYPPRPATPSPADSASVSERRPSFHDPRHGREDEGHERFGPGHRKQASLAFATDEQRRPWSRRRADLSSLFQKLLAHRWFKWIRPKLTWGQLKPVVRTAISSWIGLVLLLIVPVERALGYGAFFLLIVGFMIPPHEPIVQTLEKYLYLFFFAGVAWIWVILAVLIAGATRDAPNAYKVAAAEAKWAHLKQSDPVKYAQRVIFEAPYLQAKPAVVYAIFLATGTGALLWWKLQTQPNPATFPLVLSCILIDISLTTAVFYPSNTYTSGLIFFLPMAVQAGIGALCSVVIFPESVGYSFQSKFVGILAPLVSAMESIEELFAGVERAGVERAEQADHSHDHSHEHSLDPSLDPSLALWTRQSKAAQLHDTLDAFRRARRATIQPYRHLFDPSHPAEPPRVHARGLFQHFVAHYHLVEFADALLALAATMQQLDAARPRRRLWLPPRGELRRHLCKSQQDPHLTGDDADADDDLHDDDELGDATQRDPEVRPFDRPALNVLARVVRPLDVFRSRGFLYALKAGVLGALTTLPNFVASSATFYYLNRGVWCTIMRGDTATAWLGRVVASFWGCVGGMAIWYIGSGSSSGNPYGIAAVCALAFPAAAFFRVHFPGAVLTAVMTPVTMGLVIGYSYYNGTLGPLTHAQWGWDVAWRRFLCVLIGITAAWLFAYIPPVFSAKRAVRRSYAQAIGVAGSILCDVLSDANDPHDRLRENDAVRKHLVAWRSKLNRLGSRHVNATREVSLRGQWPEERYEALLETLQDTFSLLSQLHHVLVQLDRPWRRALLARTRLSDPLFLGDVLVVLSVCSTALRTGTALPQITPSPLLARFRMGKTKGLDIPLGVVDGIPSRVTVDVLESDEYMRYALGITTTFSLVSRLDRMVVICKTLLGENYHIHGLRLEQASVV
nr:hypothetical protein L204_02618 [Cryptococcus depauperatus CBS 7855]